MVFQAGFISFIRTILVIAAVFYGVRLIMRYLLPFLLGRFIKRQEKNFRQNFGNQQDNSQSKEGEVNVEGNSKRTAKNDNLGEYVEYEEIEENKK